MLTLSRSLVGAQLFDQIRTPTLSLIGVGNIVNMLAPEAVILGGGVSTAGEQLLEPLRRQVQSRVKMLPAEKIGVLQAALGNESGIYGALILARRALTCAAL